MNPYISGRQQGSYHTRRLILLLLTPSWLSGLITVCLALSITAALLLEGHYQGSDIQRQYLHWRVATDADSAGSAASTLQHSTQGIVAGLELFIFWYAVGTAIYLVISALYRTIASANAARRSLYYVNISRAAFLRTVYTRLALRALSLAAWCVYSVLTLRVVMPYLLGAIHVGDVHTPAIGAVALLMVATLGLALAFHIHVVLLRLFLLRPRVFYGDAVGLLSTSRQ